MPAFNKGDHQRCAEIYRDTLKALAADERVSSRLRKGLSMVLDRSKHMDDSTDQAWLYRRSLNHAYQSVTD